MLKVNLAMLDSDPVYLMRMSTALSIRFRDKLDVNTFTEMKKLEQFLDANKIDVLLVSDTLDYELSEIVSNCAVAYLADSNKVESINEKRTICKYQKIESMYRGIIGICSEQEVDNYRYISKNNSKTQVVSFCSCSGGTGSSTVAAAFSCKEAALGKKVLYLNLEQFGSPRMFFSGEGTQSLSDVVFAIKCKKANLATKFESSVMQDRSGVYFFDECNLPQDLLELSDEEVVTLIDGLIESNFYDYLVIDQNLQLNTAISQVIYKSSKIFTVTDGSYISNAKLYRMIESLKVLESQSGSELISKISIINNKTSNSSVSPLIPTIEINTHANIPLINENTPKDVMIKVSGQLP